MNLNSMLYVKVMKARKKDKAEKKICCLKKMLLYQVISIVNGWNQQTQQFSLNVTWPTQHLILPQTSLDVQQKSNEWTVLGMALVKLYMGICRGNT